MNSRERTLAHRFHDALQRGMSATRYLDRYYRDGFDRVLRPPLVALVQAIINRRREPEGPGLAEERILPGEGEMTRAIIAAQGDFMRTTYAIAVAERVGNTKTYGAVRASFEVLPDLPARVRHGVFAEPRTFPAWVRFGGPGPLSPPDMRDNGLLSIGIKLMGVEGPKLLDDEHATQDFTGLSSPTFTTPDLVENVKLQQRLREGLPAFYFLDPRDPHLLDAIMQGLYARAQTSPLEASYWSTVPYLLGPAQAMRFSVHPRSLERTPLPRRPGANYLRHAMAATLARTAVEFDFRVQIQTDARTMPIENASVIWPERLSPAISVARLRVPVQGFDSPEQLAFARSLSFQPWHCIAAHRPLGSQNRARRAIYHELSVMRQRLNGDPRVEPDGNERF
ncbi:MAG: hypothetical protein QOK21_320 [Solirubrobacteraceae bacterium]|jgi:hypothetical protein|nr:hypothetical protein [Solirubrobacteraceae bacterium]